LFVKNVEPPNQAIDPADNYPKLLDELVAWAPHGTRTFAEDNRRVFALIADFLDDANLPHIEDARLDEDGRAAYFMLYDHHCSASVVSLVITNAEIALRDARYAGDDRRNNWESFLAKMKLQHTILDYLRRRGLYAGVDDHSKVRYLLTAIVDSRLEAGKASCYGDPAKMKSFEACVHALSMSKGFTETSRKKLNVSATSTEATPWYTNEQFKAFPKEKRETIATKRRQENEERGATGGGSGGRGGKGGKGGKGPLTRSR
jgi:hypothetical protein